MEAQLKPYEPTFRERSTTVLANFLRDKLGVNNYKSYDIARGIMGDENASSMLEALGVADFTPAGALFGGQEGARMYQRSDDLLGKGIGGGTVLVSALEGLGPLGLAIKTGRKVLPKAVKPDEPDKGRRTVVKGLAALPVAGSVVAKGIADLPIGTASKIAKAVPNVTGSKLLDGLPFVQNQLKDVFYLRLDSPKPDLQGLYHLDSIKTELEELAGMPRFPGPSLRNKEELLDKPLDDFLPRVQDDKRELVEEVVREGYAMDIQSPITFELIEDFIQQNPGMTLRKAIEKIDTEINTILKSKDMELSDLDLSSGYLVDTEMQIELGANRPVYMGAPMKNTDPDKTFRVGDVSEMF